jgi:hypothetical protein
VIGLLGPLGKPSPNVCRTPDSRPGPWKMMRSVALCLARPGLCKGRRRQARAVRGGSGTVAGLTVCSASVEGETVIDGLLRGGLRSDRAVYRGFYWYNTEVEEEV